MRVQFDGAVSALIPSRSLPGENARPDDTRARQAKPSTDAPPTVAQTSRVLIELDHASQRFVQTHLDMRSGDIERRFPGETQLAFSRGVSAYVQAVRRARLAGGVSE